jgi:CheY-like chemotaxis protein
MEGARAPVQPRHLLGELAGTLRETFPASIRINVPPCGPLWTVSGDPLQLHQALLNLCLNARDAMPRGGTLTLSAESRVLDESGEARPGPYVAFKIAATGATRSETRDRIVNPLFAGKETGDGAAPGLSTALAIVKGHHGFAHLGSQAGLGTVFQVFLPADGSPADEAVAAPDHPAPLGDGELILVVDDEEAILDISRRTLEKRGYRVLTAAEGATAVALYAQHAREIAVVLTDMAMPVMDGISTLHALRRINPSVKVVASSGMGSNVNAARITDAGIKFFLRKPYRVDTLLKILREAIDSPAPSSAHN